jgi:hypothetical protein
MSGINKQTNIPKATLQRNFNGYVVSEKKYLTKHFEMQSVISCFAPQSTSIIFNGLIL